MSAEEVKSDEPKPEGVTLCPEQETALQRILQTRGNIILTGKAGSGKSTVVQALAKRTPVVLCATTGRAALNIGGCTIDRLFSIRRDTWQVASSRKLEENMIGTPELIVIDEASMVGASMATMVRRLALAYRKRLCLVCDMAQASPVKDEWGVTSALFLEADLIRLVENHRQADATYLAALNQVRTGVVDDLVHQVFGPCLVQAPPEDDAYLRLYATNRATDEYNLKRLHMVKEDTAIVVPEADFVDLRDTFDARKEGLFEEDFKEKQKLESRLCHREPMRVGARVILTMNETQNDLWVNGDTGVIVDMMLIGGGFMKEVKHDPWGLTEPVSPKHIAAMIVRLDRGREVLVQRMTQPTSTPTGKPHYGIHGFPLRLGWAITIHRCQGMTVDKAYLDMQTIMWMQGESKHGLAYVAMSRTRTLDGLKIGNWDDRAVYCADAVKSFI